MMFLKKICRVTVLFAACVIGLFLLWTGWFYATCPVYIFDEPRPFAGEKFYNPYQAVVGDTWQKSVFHLHTKSWLGLTNGNNSYEEMINVYRQLRYDVIAISDYMRINRNQSDTLLFIPVYEHGYNLKKVHQLALGARKVVWRDYFFAQNLHHKQHMIDVMKRHSMFVAVNHPGMRSSYPPDDFRYLSGYDLFEVQNGTHLSEAAWDAALSSGYPAWLIANDDAHSINNPARLQREVTYIHALSSDADKHSALSSAGNGVLDRLTQGISFGVHFPRKPEKTMEDLMVEAAAVTFPVSIRVVDDTLRVIWQQTMRTIEFIGDNGNVLKTVTNSAMAHYPIRPQDSYVRVKLTSPENLVYYLNPVVRSSDGNPIQPTPNQINKSKTFQKRAICLLFFGICIFCGLQIATRQKRKATT